MRLQTPEGLHKRVSVNANTAKQLNAPINNLIVSTKATQVSDALYSISDHIAPGARIILLLNGMGYQQAVLEEYANCRLFAAVTTDGAWLRKPFDVVQAVAVITNTTDKCALAPELLKADDRIRYRAAADKPQVVIAVVKPG